MNSLHISRKTKINDLLTHLFKTRTKWYGPELYLTFTEDVVKVKRSHTKWDETRGTPSQSETSSGSSQSSESTSSTSDGVGYFFTEPRYLFREPFLDSFNRTILVSVYLSRTLIARKGEWRTVVRTHLLTLIKSKEHWPGCTGTLLRYVTVNCCTYDRTRFL